MAGGNGYTLYDVIRPDSVDRCILRAGDFWKNCPNYERKRIKNSLSQVCKYHSNNPSYHECLYNVTKRSEILFNEEEFEI